MAEAEIDVDKLPEGKGVYIGDTGEKAEHPTRLGDIIAMLDVQRAEEISTSCQRCSIGRAE